jgi:hypothetical protein
MKPFACLLLLLLLVTSAHGDDTKKALADVRARFLTATTKQYGEVQIDSASDHLTISCNTMTYQIHSTDKTGRISETAHEEVGPNVNGFILSIVPQKGPYRGAAHLPQTIARPYWKTFATFIPTDDNQNHLHISLSFGRKVPDKVVVELIAAIENK